MGMAASIPLITVEDLDSFPDDGNRYELLDGMLLVTPSPNQEHQVVATRLSATGRPRLRRSARSSSAAR